MTVATCSCRSQRTPRQRFHLVATGPSLTPRGCDRYRSPFAEFLHELDAALTPDSPHEHANHMVVRFQTHLKCFTEAVLCSRCLSGPKCCIGKKLRVKEVLVRIYTASGHFSGDSFDLSPITAVGVRPCESGIGDDVWPNAIGLHALEDSCCSFSVAHLATGIDDAAVDDDIGADA